MRDVQRWGARLASTCAAAALVVACDGDPSGPGDCSPALGSSSALVQCLADSGALTGADLASADSVLADARFVMDSLEQVASPANYDSFGLVLASIRQFEDLFDAGKLTDSARVNRMIDHIAVTLEWVREAPQPDSWGMITPRRTPGLGWLMRTGIGVYFEPGLTVEQRMGFVPGVAPVPADGIALGEALWSYRRHLDGPGGPAAVWELFYSSRSCLSSVAAPRTSAEVQGSILAMFSALYKSTQDQRWRDRGHAIVVSLQLPRENGGVREADTTGGYWFRDGAGGSRVWRGHAIALIAVLDFASITGDSVATRIGAEGLRAAKVWTPEFDTGNWTRPCLTGGYSDVNGHNLMIALARALHDRTGDVYWQATADKWASYTNPFASLTEQ